MLKTRIEGVAAVVLAAVSCAHAQDAVQWRVEDGGNGHWYRLVDAAMPWGVHQDRASSIGASLCCVEDEAEWEFLAAQLTPQAASGADIWLGGFRAKDGVLTWLDGTPITYANWAPNEPSPGYAVEICARSNCEIVFGWNVEEENSPSWPGNWAIDEWSVDCNDDGIVDYGQILDGSLEDCNENGILDVCEITETFEDSEPRTPESVVDFIEFDVSAMADARDAVILNLSARGDLATSAEFMFVYLDDVNLGLAFATDGASCEAVSAMFEIPAADWNLAGLDGTRLIRISGNAIEPDACETPFTAVDVAVPLVFEDCNTNGLWDACEIAEGTLIDTDADGISDDCDGCPNDQDKTSPGICGCGVPDVGDTDGDGVIDCVDPCPDWPYACSGDGQTLLVAVGQPIQLAIDVVAEGGVVQLSAGTHEPTDTILVGRSIELVGTTDGDGNPTSEIDGARIGGRAFDVALDEGDTWAASDLIISNCNAGLANGGAMRLAGGAAILLNARFEDNTSEGDGGALSAEQSVAMQLIDCVFTGNQAEDGGAIHQTAGSNLSISGGRFEGNGAVIDTGGPSDFNCGGAINQSSSSGVLDITNCEFIHNRTEHDDGGGGAIFFQAEITISNCTFAGNSTDDSGGALFTDNAPRFTILDSVFTENIGGDFESGSGNGFGNVGGAIGVKAPAIGIIEGCSFTRNFAALGGAAYLRDGVETNWTNCLIDENSAYWACGAVSIVGSDDGVGSVATFNNCTITRSSKQASNDGASTIQSNVNCLATFNSCEITGNLGSGPILRFPSTPGVFQNTVVCDNEGSDISGDFADLGGNCISELCDRDEDGTLDCVDGCPDDPGKIDPGQCGCGIEDVDTDADGIADCVDPCPTWPYDCSADGQTILVADGQSIQQAITAAPAGGMVDIAAGTFAPGGSIDPGGKAVTIRGAVDEFGQLLTTIDAGGLGSVMVFQSGEGPATVIRDLVLTGGAAVHGGGIECSNASSPTILGCFITGNTASEYGGGINCYLGCNSSIEACIISGNAATLAGGGASIDGSSPTILDCVIESNTAPQGAGMYFYESDDAGLGDSTVCGNDASQVSGNYTDLEGNCILDECDDDLDGNGVPDSCDPDCNGDGVPDSLETDCDGNGIPDECEITDGSADDCNENSVPDYCDIVDGFEEDDNLNQIPDSCEVARGDLDLDGCIDSSDLGLLIALWGFADPPIGDLNDDGVIAAADLGLLIGNWSPCP